MLVVDAVTGKAGSVFSTYHCEMLVSPLFSKAKIDVNSRQDMALREAVL
jgi:hypothetical protein